jgi:putative heme-binding domain-containing protein
MEVLKPPYAAVKQQEATQRMTIPVRQWNTVGNARTIEIEADDLPWRCTYSVAIPGVKAPGAAGPGQTVDVDFGLNGMVGEWFQKGSEHAWHAHLSTDVADRWATGVGPTSGIGVPVPAPLQFPLPSDYTRGFLRASLDLPGNERTLTLRSKTPFSAHLGKSIAEATKDGGQYVATVASREPGLLDLVVEVALHRPLWFDASYHTDEDPHERPIPIERLILPWAKNLPLAPDAPVEHKPRGDWARGRAVFFGAEAKCSTCHTVRGEGGTLGPDLSNLTFKDPDAVLNDVVAPSAAINPDYISYNVKLKTGELLTGLVAADGDQFKVTEAVDKTTAVKRGDVASMTPGTISIMPEGFKALGDEKLNDLLEFLTGEAPKK